MIHSMTGYASRTFSVGGQDFKVELKSLNHRFLELKLRIPKEWSLFEPALRTLFETRLKRGSVEMWVEMNNGAANGNSPTLNLTQAEEAYRLLTQLQHRFNLTEPISLRDLVSFPEVLSRGPGFSLNEENQEELRKALFAATEEALKDLVKMREQEGEKLNVALIQIVKHFRDTHASLLSMREQLQARAKEKVRKRIEQAFEAYPTPDQQLRSLMEARVGQEISYALEKLDIEEELTRFKGHLDQIETILKQGGIVGKKLDFMFQELNREINTLGNKSQDLEISQQVIQLKTWVEQLREQSLNLE